MRWRSFLRLVIKLACLGAVALAPVAAQTGLGVVQGTVLDSTRAAVPNAKVTLINAQTGVARTAQSNAVGVYYFASVPIGPYSLSVEAVGFKRWSSTLQVAAGQTVVVDPVLDVGSVESVVEVTGAAPVVTTVGMEVNDVKDALRIQQLPLNGRAITNLFDLTPGVEGAGSPRVNGLKVGSAEMLLDGVSLVDRFGGGIARVQPGLDTIQEFRIETAGSSAQYSRPATISLVTKSGTNEFHGSAFETHRNNFGGLRARQRQDLPAPGQPFRPPQLIRNEFGVTAGGPIVRNKTFWFAAYEGLRQRQAQFAQARVPPPEMWAGDLSSAITAASERISIYDPFSTRADGTRLPFPENRIPATRISKFAESMRSVSPDPAGPNATINPFLGNNFAAYYPNQNNTDTLTLKGDHVFSAQDSLSGRFTRSWALSKVFGGVFGYPRPGSTDAGGSSLSDAKVYSSFLRWNRVFTPTFLNELQVSSHRAPKSSGTLANDVNWPDRLGLPNPFGVTGWPTICASGNSPFFYGGCWDGDNRKDEMLTAHQLDDNVTWIRGKHSIKFGGKVRYEYNNIRELQQSQGSHTFGSAWTAQYDPRNDQAVSFTGVGFASLLMGLPTFLSNQYNRGYFYFEQQEVGLYVHDSWKVHPRVTLELGVRWDKWTAYEEKYNRMVNVNLNTFADRFEVVTPKNVRMEDLPGIPPSVLASWKVRGLTWKTAREAGLPDNLIPADNNNFGPRVGAAIRLTDRWILRAGYGEYFWTMPLSQILQTSRTNPPLNLRFSNSIGDRNGQAPNYALKSAPGADDFVGKATVPTEGIFPISINAQGMMPWDHRSWSDNRAQEWTFTIERELMKDTALRLSYIGNHGRDLEQRFAINSIESEWNYQARTGLARPSRADLRRLNPNWNFNAANHTGFSNTTSFQAEVERRYSNGLGFQWFYTFTHTLTTTDAGGFTSGNGSVNATDGAAFQVPERIQILGAPEMTYDQLLRLGYYNTANVPAHRIRYNGIYTLPFGRGRRFLNSVSKGVDAVVGGWELAFIGDWRSGFWRSVSSGLYLFGDPTLSPDQRLEMSVFGRRQRLWFRGDFDPRQATNVDQTRLQQLVPVDRSQRVLRPVGSAFDNRIPQRLADGTVRLTPITDNVNWNARNFFRGPGAWNLDFSVFKHFRPAERVDLRLTADFFNLFNHPNDVNPSSSTGLQDLSVQANAPRIIQFSLRVSW